MSSVIHKYMLNLVDCQVIRLPKGFEILTAQVQFGNVCLWVKHDKDETRDRVDVPVYTIGTGNDIDDLYNLKYISTIQMCEGSLIFHMFYTPI